MAATALARVTGPVLNIDVRSGISPRTQQSYRIETVRVLAEGKDVTEFTVPDGEPHRFIEGEDVDVLVEFSTYNGQLRGRLSKVLATV